MSKIINVRDGRVTAVFLAGEGTILSYGTPYSVEDSFVVGVGDEYAPSAPVFVPAPVLQPVSVEPVDVPVIPEAAPSLPDPEVQASALDTNPDAESPVVTVEAPRAAGKNKGKIAASIPAVD